MQKTAVVTGATAGIGLAVAKELAARGVRVVGIGRSPERCESARQEVLAANPQADIRYLLCDLSSQRQIRDAAAEMLAVGEPVDALIHCAGAVSSHFLTTEDGIERQFAVNHLGPFLLTHELLPALRAAGQARVIIVSSDSHYRTRLNFGDLQMRRHYSCLWQYKHTKLCNVLFAAELNRRLGDSLRAFAADPGLVRTEIGLKGTTGLEKMFWQRHMKKGTPPEVPARNICFLALEDAPMGSYELYWKDCKPQAPSAYSLREDAAALWQASDKLCGIDGW